MKTEEAWMRAVTRIAVGLVVLAGLAKAAAGAPDPKAGWNDTVGVGSMFFPKYTGGSMKAVVA
jgi:outer membrane scaffolding protein for murein synthesis (MipA/OmpV family)